MTVLHTPPGRLYGDYVRSFFGISVPLGVIIFGRPGTVVLIILCALIALFGYLAFMAVSRHVARVAVADEGIAVAGLTQRQIPWLSLEAMRLRHYATRSQAKKGAGMLELRLIGNGTRIVLDSSLMGFRYVAWCAAKAAREYQAKVDPMTAGHLLDLGIDIDHASPAPEIDDELAVPRD